MVCHTSAASGLLGEAKNRLPRIYVKLHAVSRHRDWRKPEKPIFDGSIMSTTDRAKNRSTRSCGRPSRIVQAALQARSAGTGGHEPTVSRATWRIVQRLPVALLSALADRRDQPDSPPLLTRKCGSNTVLAVAGPLGEWCAMTRSMTSSRAVLWPGSEWGLCSMDDCVRLSK